jgi:ubiquinone/menaquinone biosynthesis C-methylase UbiE
VADLGSGVGYFSLKLAPKVAEHGSVLAEDILGDSLAFLWVRALLHHQPNIRIIHGKTDDPLLPPAGVDAVLIGNSYHEFTKPLAILGHTLRALRSGDDSLSSIAGLALTTEGVVKSRSGLYRARQL